MDVLLATRNRGKLNELEALFAGTQLRVISLSDANIADEVEETGTTFAENAIAKAVAYSRLVSASEPHDPRTPPASIEPARPGAVSRPADSASPNGGPGRSASPDRLRSVPQWTLADDSGLVVDALDGAPGVLSARYGGDGLSDEDRCALLLRRLEGVPRERRAARFVCVLALARAGSLVRTFGGTVEGMIAFEPSGSNGFGYDPVFDYPPLGRTFAELSPAEKDRVSHRGQALRALIGFLETGLAGGEAKEVGRLFREGA